MDLVGLLKKNEQPLRNCCVVVGALQRRDSLTLSVGVPPSAPNEQFGVFKKVFQVRAGHTGLNQPTSPRRLCAFSHTNFGDAGRLTQIVLTAAMQQHQLIEGQIAAFLASAPIAIAGLELLSVVRASVPKETVTCALPSSPHYSQCVPARRHGRAQMAGTYVIYYPPTTGYPYLVVTFLRDRILQATPFESEEEASAFIDRVAPSPQLPS